MLDLFQLDGKSDVPIVFTHMGVGAHPMLILGIPDGVDPATVRPSSDWRLSKRTQRELALRESLIAEARESLAELSDDELRAEVDGELNDAASRDEMLDYLAEQAGSDVEIEVVYPGAYDPTESAC